MDSHVIDYKIHGNDMQVVSIELDPNETVIAEAGSMNWMDSGISFEAKMGDGTEPDSGIMGKLFSVGKRVLTGESIFLTHFTNVEIGKKEVAFAAPYPGSIIAVDLKDINGEILCQKDAFLCAAMGTNVSIAFNKRIGAGFFGGEGFILQKLTGNGLAFLHAGGTVIKKELNNETLFIDTGCIVAFSTGLDYSIERAGNLKSMIFGGEGLFLATVKGTGTVYLQSLPFSSMADRILQNAPKNGGKSKGEWKQVARYIDKGVFGEEDLQKINRYFISKTGVKILKVNKKDNREIQLEAGKWLQTVFNKMEVQPKWETYNIDKTYYLMAIETEINNILTVNANQLKLF